MKTNKPKILIDARLYGPTHTGIGRYTKNLLFHLSKEKTFSNYEFVLLVYPNLLKQIKKDLKDKYQYIPTKIKHYSLQEQVLLPFLINKIKPDLVHFLHFDKPIFYFNESIITIHDLIKHFFKGSKTTTRFTPLYWIKYFAYILISKINIKNNHIIVPSNFWRKYIIKNFKVPSKKINTTYEAVDPYFLNKKLAAISNPQNYIIYTGNLYPHKNIDVVFEALKEIPEISLYIISARNIFTKRIQDQINKFGVKSQVKVIGYQKDKDLPKIYQHAIALVHPSLMEGFSLTGLEAMSMNCPVISSNASCLPEIYQDAVLYFNPYNKDELVTHIKNLVASNNLRHDLISKGKNLVKQYSWSTTANKTISIYQKIFE